MSAWQPFNRPPRRNGWFVVEMNADDGGGNVDVWKKTIFWSKRKGWEGSTLNAAFYYSIPYEYEVDPSKAPLRAYG